MHNRKPGTRNSDVSDICGITHSVAIKLHCPGISRKREGPAGICNHVLAGRATELGNRVVDRGASCVLDNTHYKSAKLGRRVDLQLTDIVTIRPTVVGVPNTYSSS